MTNKPVYQELSSLIAAIHNCSKNSELNKIWLPKHTNRLKVVEKECLPSGSGIDNGSCIDITNSTPEKLVILTSFHFMDSNGFYNGWKSYKIIVTGSLQYGINIKIVGKNKDDIKDHLFEVFDYALRSNCT